MAGRDIFAELMEGVEAIGEHREGKVTLRTHSVPADPPPPVDGDYVRETREELQMSLPVFARSLRLKSRSLEGWEHGRTPNAAAKVLIGLVRKYPDTISRIASLERKPVKKSGTSSSTRKQRRITYQAKQKKFT